MHLCFVYFTQHFHEVGAYSQFADDMIEAQRGSIIFSEPSRANTVIPILSGANFYYFSSHNIQYSIKNYKTHQKKEKQEKMNLLSRDKAIKRTRLRDDLEVWMIRGV